MHILAALVLLASPLAAAELAPAELVPPTETPVEGQPSVLRFVVDGRPAVGVVVEARYRTNAHASLQHTQPIGQSDSSGRVEWTPLQPGVIELVWEAGPTWAAGTTTIAVRHDGLPLSGVLVAIVAGVLLIGGSALFFHRMLREPHTTPEAETHRVDT